MTSEPLPVCPVCHTPYRDYERHHRLCTGPPSQPVHEVAQTIANGGAFGDGDAVRLAREYLAVTGVRRTAS